MPDLYVHLSVGSLFNGIYNDLLCQFAKHPALSLKFTRNTFRGTSTITFKPEAEYDDKDRLLKFKLYIEDYPYFSHEIQITCYK